MENELELPEFHLENLTPGAGEIVCPVRTQPLHEFRVRDFCVENGIGCYLPLKQTWRLTSTTKNGKRYQYQRNVLRPLFPSYLFVRMDREQHARLFSTKSLLGILPVPDSARFLEELRLVRQVEMVGLQEHLDFHPGIKEGDRFLIESGPWKGVCGWLRKRNRQYLWTVEIEFIQELVETTIDPSQYKLRKLDESLS